MSEDWLAESFIVSPQTVIPECMKDNLIWRALITMNNQIILACLENVTAKELIYDIRDAIIEIVKSRNYSMLEKVLPILLCCEMKKVQKTFDVEKQHLYLGYYLRQILILPFQTAIKMDDTIMIKSIQTFLLN